MQNENFITADGGVNTNVGTAQPNTPTQANATNMFVDPNIAMQSTAAPLNQDNKYVKWIKDNPYQAGAIGAGFFGLGYYFIKGRK